MSDLRPSSVRKPIDHARDISEFVSPATHTSLCLIGSNEGLRIEFSESWTEFRTVARVAARRERSRR